MALSWLRQKVIDSFCQGLIDSSMEALFCIAFYYFVGRCVVEEANIKDASNSTVYLSSTRQGGGANLH